MTVGIFEKSGCFAKVNAATLEFIVFVVFNSKKRLYIILEAC